MKASRLFFFLFLNVTIKVHAQTYDLNMSANYPVPYKKLGAVQGAAGVIGESYYVIEQDYGTRFDMSNNVKTVVSVFSINTLKLKKTIDLGADVALTRKEANKIIFTKIVTWKDRLIAFYTFKGTGKNFFANALIYDSDGKVIRDQSICEFPFDNTQMATGIFNARGKMALSGAFHLRFTPDSSRMIILATAPVNTRTNVLFKIYRPDMVLEKDVPANLPLDKTSGELIEFLMNNEGSIYALARTEKNKGKKKEDNNGDYNYFFYSLSFSNAEVKQQRLAARDKAIVSMGFGLSATGKPICMGFYNNPEVKKAEGQIHGAFTVLPQNGNGGGPTVSLKPIAESVLKDFLFEKDFKKGFGLNGTIEVIYTKIRKGGGLIAICRDERTAGTGTGTGYEISLFPTLLFIDDEGKIILDSYYSASTENKEFATRRGRLEYFLENNNAEAFRFHKSFTDKWGLNIIKITAGGIDKAIQVKETPQAFGFMIVENSVIPLAENEYIGTTFTGNGTGADAINIFRVIRHP